MVTSFPQSIPSTMESLTNVDLQALFPTIRSQIMATSTLLPDPRALLCLVPNAGHDRKFTLDYTDAQITAQDVADKTDLTFHEAKYFSRIFHCKNRALAETTSRLIPDAKLMDVLATIYKRLNDASVAAVLSDTLKSLMGVANQQIADWYNYDSTPAARTVVEQKTRADDGWIDMHMSGTEVISDLTPETPPYKFTALLTNFAGKHSKELSNNASPGAGDIVLCDKNYFMQFYNSLMYRSGSPNLLIDKDQYAPLAQRMHDAGMSDSDFAMLRIGDRNWLFALYGDRDAMSTPSVFFDFLENDPSNTGYSQYPVMFAACRNTWYSAYAPWDTLNTAQLSTAQPHTLAIHSMWQNGTGRMPGATQGAMWGRIRNATLLQANPGLNLFKTGSYGMDMDQIEKFYTDAGAKEKGAEYRKSWEEYAKAQKQSADPETRTKIEDIEKNRGSTKTKAPSA